MANQESKTGIGKFKVIGIVVIVLVAIVAGAFAYQTSVRPTPSAATTTAAGTSTSLQGADGGQVTLNGAGSSLVFPLMSDWTHTYTQLKPNVKVNYASIGSGAGIAQITAKTIDFGATDAPMTPTQYAAASGILHIPESISAVVPAYNIPGISNGLKFTGPLLADIFLGKVTKWNDPEITTLNPGVNLPDHDITVVHRSDGSGTMYTFTNYLSDSNSQWKTQVGKGTSVNWPTGLGGKGNEGVAGIIANTPYSLGPAEIAYVLVNPGKLFYGAVRNAAGNFILANLTNIAAAVQAGASGLPGANADWSKVSIVDRVFNSTPAKNAYPITTFTYLLVYQQQTDRAKGTALVDFLWWIVNSGQQDGTRLGYVPLPSNVVTLDDAAINSITYNSIPLHSAS